MSDDRTEKPTGKKLNDARKKGQIAQSRDLAMAGATVAATLAIGRLGGRLIGGLSDRLARDLAHVGDQPLRTVTAGDLNGLIVAGVTALVVLVGPIALAVVVASVAMQALQGGVIFSMETLHLNWGRLNPAQGIQRFTLIRAGADTLKTMVAVTAIAWLAWGTVQAMFSDAVAMAWMTPLASSLRSWQHVESFLWKTAWALMAIGAADYGLQYYRHMSSMKMTKQEVKDEAKQIEGDVHTKGRIRAIQRDMARRRMISDVARATVVITNPTHYAVALEYRRGEMMAPVVLAKGRDHLAAAIREQARQHGVPMVENKPLAQTLYKTAEVGQTIPGPLFAAVAEVLAQLIRLKQLQL
jgi:flagellar biosynthetic protein FlhB